MKQLIDKNPSNYYGATPLHYAAKEGHFQICKLILEKVLDKHLNEVMNYLKAMWSHGQGLMFQSFNGLFLK